MQLRVNQSGRHGVHANPFVCHLARQPNRKSVNRALGGRVVYPFARTAGSRGQRRNVHDRSTLSPRMPRRHPAHCLPRTQNRPRDVYRQHPRETRGVYLINTRETSRNRGIVHQRSNGPQLALRNLKDPQNVSFSRNVALNAHRTRSNACQMGQDLLSRRLIVRIIDGDTVSARSQQFRDSRSDSTASAGDNRDPSIWFLHISSIGARPFTRTSRGDNVSR